MRNLYRLRIAEADSGQFFNIAANPPEAAFFIGMRIKDPRNLLRVGKEILLDKKIMLRKENAEAGMRVIPADNLMVRIFLVLDLIYMFPGVLGKRNVRAALRGIHAGDASLHSHALIFNIANEDATNLSLH